MDEQTKRRVEAVVLEILREADMETTTEHKVRKMASERLGLDLSVPDRKLFVRSIVESFLSSNNDQANQDNDPKLEEQDRKEDEEGRGGEEEEKEEEEDDDEEEEMDSRKKKKEYDDNGDLIICQLSNKRRVTIQDFRGKTLISIREYYEKDGKQLPTSKGISLTAEQWEAFRNSLPAIQDAIKEMEDSD